MLKQKLLQIQSHCVFFLVRTGFRPGHGPIIFRLVLLLWRERNSRRWWAPHLKVLFSLFSVGNRTKEDLRDLDWGRSWVKGFLIEEIYFRRINSHNLRWIDRLNYIHFLGWWVHYRSTSVQIRWHRHVTQRSVETVASARAVVRELFLFLFWHSIRYSLATSLQIYSHSIPVFLWLGGAFILNVFLIIFAWFRTWYFFIKGRLFFLLWLPHWDYMLLLRLLR